MMDSALTGLLVGITGLLLSVFICAISVTVQLGQLKKIGKDLIDLFHHSQKQQDKHHQSLERIEAIEKAHGKHNGAVLDELRNLAARLASVQNEASNYSKLLIDVRDFYAALKDFGDGMDQSFQVSGKLAATLQKFQEAVIRAHQAAGDFNQVLAMVQRRQDEISDHMKELMTAMERQGLGLEKLLAESKISVQVEMSLETDALLRGITNTLQEQIVVSKDLARGIGQILDDSKGGLLSKLFGGR